MRASSASRSSAVCGAINHVDRSTLAATIHTAYIPAAASAVVRPPRDPTRPTRKVFSPPRTMNPTRAAAKAVESDTSQLSAANGDSTYTIPGG